MNETVSLDLEIVRDEFWRMFMEKVAAQSQVKALLAEREKLKEPPKE